MIVDPSIKDRPILIVEDDEDLSSLMASRLRNEGYRVRVVGNWAEGEKALEESLPDILIMDLNLPDANGMEVIESLRLNDRTKDLPVIITSGADETENLVRGIKSGVLYFVAKPYDLEHLVGKIRSAVFRRFQMNPGESSA